MILRRGTLRKAQLALPALYGQQTWGCNPETLLPLVAAWPSAEHCTLPLARPGEDSRGRRLREHADVGRVWRCPQLSGGPLASVATPKTTEKASWTRRPPSLCLHAQPQGRAVVQDVLHLCCRGIFPAAREDFVKILTTGSSVGVRKASNPGAGSFQY